MKEIKVLDRKDLSVILFLALFILHKVVYMTKNMFSAAMASIVEDGAMTKAETGAISAGLYTANAADWTQGTITFKEGFEGLVKITIQDYQFCKPTTIYVYVVENPEILYEIVKFNKETGNKNVGIINFEEFLTKEMDIQ